PNEFMTVVHNRALVREALKRLWGWTEEDVATYYDTQRLDRLKTKYITDPQELAQYAVVPGPVFKDARGNPLDTSTMISKASGPGWGIFVMAEDGKLFVGRHKVGLFHHSSFTAGEDVASAGELQVIGGTLKGITAKSGHYMPTPAHMVQLLHRLDAAGADLAGVPCKVWLITRETGARTLVYDSADLLANGDKARVLSEGAMY
ncbi:MAG TPA: hypothetical protein VFZ00_00950, partial [Solirubrobacter sp.]|nr:hypothetical protein [Solirubrobacter sp.]